VLPQADPLFTDAEALSSQVASAQETHIFSPNMLNTMTFGFTRATFNFDPVATTQFPRAYRLCRRPAGGIVVSGAVTTTGPGAITSAGTNNASNSWNRRNLFTYAMTSRSRRHSSFQRRRLVSTAARQRGFGFASAGCSDICHNHHVAAGDCQHVSGVRMPTNWVEKLVRRVVRAG